MDPGPASSVPPKAPGTLSDATRELFRKAGQAVATHAMLETGDRVLVGVSGGADSTALLHYLLEIQEQSGLSIGIAHVNHCLRGDESDRDEIFVRNLSETLCLPFHGTRQEVGQLAAKHKTSLEDEARQVRYRFYRKVMRSQGYTKTALGHTLDDTIELVLMNLLRGSGPRGLAGIPPVRDGWIIRPLILVPKETAVEYLRDLGQGYVTDSSNLDTSILRNRVRHQLLPLLRADYNPGVDDALDRLSRILREEQQWMDTEVDRFFSSHSQARSASEVCFPLDTVRSIHGAFQRLLFRRAISSVKGDLRRISLAHIDAALELARSPRGNRSLDLPGRIQVKRCRNDICFVRQPLPLREIGRRRKQAGKQRQAGKELLA